METCFIVWLSVLFNITTMFIIIFNVKSNFTKPCVNTEARSFNTLNTSLRTTCQFWIKAAYTEAFPPEQTESFRIYDLKGIYWVIPHSEKH